MATETIHLPPDLDEAIQSAAVRTGRAKHELMVELLERGIARQASETREPTVHRLQSLGAVSVPGVHAADMDEWLASNWHPDEEWGREEPTVK